MYDENWSQKLQLLNEDPSTRAGLLPYKLLFKEASESPKTIQAIATVVGCSRQLLGKRHQCLLLKSKCSGCKTCRNQATTEMEATCWLVLIVLQECIGGCWGGISTTLLSHRHCVLFFWLVSQDVPTSTIVTSLFWG